MKKIILGIVLFLSIALCSCNDIRVGWIITDQKHFSDSLCTYSTHKGEGYRKVEFVDTCNKHKIGSKINIVSY